MKYNWIYVWNSQKMQKLEKKPIKNDIMKHTKCFKKKKTTENEINVIKMNRRISVVFNELWVGWHSIYLIAMYVSGVYCLFVCFFICILLLFLIFNFLLSLTIVVYMLCNVYVDFYCLHYVASSCCASSYFHFLCFVIISFIIAICVCWFKQ